MALLNPYLTFNGTTREAMEHYQSVFGGELTSTTFGEAGMAGEGGPPADQTLHAQVKTDLGFTLMASDGNPNPQNGSISISGDETDAIRGYYEALAADGTVDQPLTKAPWATSSGR